MGILDFLKKQDAICQQTTDKMKKLLLLLALIVPVMANAMKIETDEVDEFTGDRTLITSWEGICGQDIHIRFRLQNGVEFLDFKKFEDSAIVIGKDDQLMFKSTDDKIGKFASVSTYSGTKGGGATGFIGGGAWGISATYKGDLSYFDTNVTRLIRLYTTDGYYDKKVGENDGKKLQKLYSLFSSALNGKPGQASSYANYTIVFFKSTDGGKSWDKVNEEYVKDASPEEITEKVSQWKSQSSDKKLFDCKIKKEK